MFNTKQLNTAQLNSPQPDNGDSSTIYNNKLSPFTRCNKCLPVVSNIFRRNVYKNK